jgi:DNA-binding protein
MPFSSDQRKNTLFFLFYFPWKDAFLSTLLKNEVNTMSRDNIVYIGRKPAMTYVMAVLATFNNQDTVEIKARGRSISTAVDVAEIARTRYINNLAKPKITIDTERISDGDVERNVSCMTIELSKEAAGTKDPAKKAAAPKAASKAVKAEPKKPVTEIKGVGKTTEEKLLSGGYDTVAKVAKADAAALAEKTTLSDKQAAKLIEAAKEL